MKRLLIGALAVLALGTPAQAGATPVPNDWFMNDGASIGVRATGTPCTASDFHEWVESSDSDYALWCNPRTMTWVIPK